MVIYHKYGIYSSNSLKSDDWKMIPNSLPENMLRPVYMTFDKDRKLALFLKKQIHTMYINIIYIKKKKLI